MKERIRQILREETSGLDPGVNAAYNMMDNLTKGCRWYYDTFRNRFKWTPESIWLINPNTEQWILELEKSGKLWYYSEIYLTFKKYFNMEESDFKLFIKLWVEDVLKRGVTTIALANHQHRKVVEDVLKRGVTTINKSDKVKELKVGDVLKKGKELR